MAIADDHPPAYEDAERCRSLARFWQTRLDELSEGWCDRAWALAEVRSLETEASQIEAALAEGPTSH